VNRNIVLQRVRDISATGDHRPLSSASFPLLTTYESGHVVGLCPGDSVTEAWLTRGSPASVSAIASSCDSVAARGREYQNRGELHDLGDLSCPLLQRQQHMGPGVSAISSNLRWSERLLG
jgi:hypothetical protein